MSSFVILFPLLLSVPAQAAPPSDDVFVHCDFITPSQNLAESRLKKEVNLANGEEIYPAVAALFDQPGVVAARLSDTKAADVSLVWETNPVADKQAFSVRLAPGTTVLQAMKEIATRRGERVTQTSNHTAITLAEAPPRLATYRRGTEDADTDLHLCLGTLMLRFITVREAVDDDVAEFINAQLQYTWTYSGKAGQPTFKFATTEGARKKMTRLNFMGPWVYGELYDAISHVLGLEWETRGNIILLQERR